MPSAAATGDEVAGTAWSGVVVHRTRSPISFGSTPATAMAARPASTANRAVVPRPSFGWASGGAAAYGPAATRRARMPDRSTIQSSVLSMRVATSALVTDTSGRAAPQPMIRTPRSLTAGLRLGPGRPGASPGAGRGDRGGPGPRPNPTG